MYFIGQLKNGFEKNTGFTGYSSCTVVFSAMKWQHKRIFIVVIEQKKIAICILVIKRQSMTVLINLITCITLINLLLQLQILLISLKPEVPKPDLFDDYRQFMKDFTQ